MISEFEMVHVSEVKSGNVISHMGEIKTVCKKDIKSGFMGHTVFGDSFFLGREKVKRYILRE